MRGSIHQLKEYVDWEFTPDALTWAVGIDSVIMFSTTFVLLRMKSKYESLKDHSFLHPRLFKSMMQMGVANLAFFVFDLLTFRLPSTGVLTSLCARFEPNRLLIIVYIGQLVSTYWSMLFTLQFCLVRLIIFARPTNHEQINKKFTSFYTKLAFVLPFAAPYFMYQGLGYCRQWDTVFRHGAVFISYTDTLLGIRKDYGYTVTTFLAPFAMTVTNGFFAYYAGKHASNTRAKSNLFNKKAKFSLVLTNLAMTVPYLAHCLLTIVCSWIVPEWSPYSILIRTPLTDIAHLGMIVYYYATHRVFNGKSNAIKPTPSGSRAAK
ncbi:unnamed protein product [Caenorhabditis nigoni]